MLVSWTNLNQGENVSIRSIYSIFNLHMEKFEELLTVNISQNVAFSSLKILSGDSKRNKPSAT